MTTELSIAQGNLKSKDKASENGLPQLYLLSEIQCEEHIVWKVNATITIYFHDESCKALRSRAREKYGN